MKNIPEMRFNGFTDAWEQRKLSDVATFSKGSGYSKSDLKENGTPIILYGRLYTNYETVISDVDTFADAKDGSVYSQGGEVIVPGSGETAEDISIASVVEKSGVLLGGDLNVIHPKEIIDSTFLAISVSNGEPHKDMARRAQGKSIVHLHNEDLAQIELSYPSVPEQEKISRYFCDIDNLITLHQRKYEKLLDVKNAMLVTMFPRLGKDKPDMRFKGYESAWQTVRLGDIVERVTRKNSNFESTLPLTISAQYGLIDQNEFFNKQVASKDVSNYYLIRNGEFAYNKSTSSDAPFGAVKRLDRYDCGVLSTLYIMFRIKEEAEVDSDYLVEYYSTNLWHEGIQKIAAEGARNHGLLNIVPDDFFNTTLMIPQNISEQRKIGQYFRSLDKLIEIKKNKVEKLQDVKKAMLQAMFV